MGMEPISNNINSYQPVSKPAAVEAAYQPAVNEAIGSAVQTGQQGKLPQQPSQEEIQHAITSANKRAQFGHTNAQFSYHENTHTISVKIIDKDTNEVIKEIPSEETLEMISKMWELAGIMVDEKR